MSLVATLRAMIPQAGPRSEVDTIVASVPKAPELIEVERAFSETAAAQLLLSKRRGEIFEKLQFQSPLRTLAKPEQDKLEAEQSDIVRRVDELGRKASELRRQIDGLTPAYAAVLEVALAEFRHQAAKNLLASIGSLEDAIADITESSKVLSSVGIRASSVIPLQYAAALRKSAEKILTETLHG